MGLSGTKNKTKLSHDPNNTAWSRDTTGFGHKIMASQGWKPGDYLGAENAKHSGHYTAANASHIRVMLREENLGIGAQVGKGNAETFGLSMFSGLLGRLNGKSDAEVEKQQSALRDVQLGAFQAQRYGFMNFVSGGLLVGDKMEFPKSTVLAGKTAADVVKKGLKRKSEQETSERPDLKKKKKKKATVEEEEVSSEDDSDAGEVGAAAQKEKRRISKAEKGDAVSTDASSKAAAKEVRRRDKAERKAAREAAKAVKSGVDSGEKARLKAERRARKEERRQRKEEKRRKRAAKTASTMQTSASSSDSDGTATPPVSGGFAGGRHAVRQRYIQQKRLASMDPQALKEIFMLPQRKAA